MESDGALVRSRRARVRSAGDEDEDPAAFEGPQGLGRSRDAVEGPDVVSILRQPGHEVRPRYRAERYDQVVAVEPPIRHVGASLRGIDRVDLGLNELNAMPCEQLARPGAVGDRSVADELPQLAQPHREPRAAVDQDDLVIVLIEQPSELNGGRDTAESAAKDQRASDDGAQVRSVVVSSSNTIVRNPSIIPSSSVSLIPGMSGNSPSRSTLVWPAAGVYVWRESRDRLRAGSGGRW